MVSYDPFGYFRIAVSTPFWGYKEDNGAEDPQAWKFHPRRTAEDQFNYWQSTIEKTEAGIADNAHLDMKVRTVPCFTLFKFGVSFVFSAAAKWDDTQGDERIWRGEAVAEAIVTCDYTYAQTIMLGFIPLIFQFGVHVGLTIAAGPAFKSDGLFDSTPTRGTTAARASPSAWSSRPPSHWASASRALRP